jgi:hypothetical protein
MAYLQPTYREMASVILWVGLSACGSVQTASGSKSSSGPGTGVPIWVEGACDRSRYLCGVGDGPDRVTADNEARSELGRIFAAKVVSVQESFEKAAQTVNSQTGETWTETQEVARRSLVQTDRVLEASEILERREDESGRHWSLAVIERAPAIRGLRDEIASLDEVIRDRVTQADAAETDPLSRLRNVRTAFGKLAAREGLNADLGVLAGQGVSAPIGLSDLLRRVDRANAGLRFGIAVEGDVSGQILSCLEAALTGRGYQVLERVQGTETQLSNELDGALQAGVTIADQGAYQGSEVVKVALTVRLINRRTGKTMSTASGSETGSRPTKESAVQTASARVCKKQVPQMLDAIEHGF